MIRSAKFIWGQLKVREADLSLNIPPVYGELSLRKKGEGGFFISCTSNSLLRVILLSVSWKWTSVPRHEHKLFSASSEVAAEIREKFNNHCFLSPSFKPTLIMIALHLSTYWHCYTGSSRVSKHLCSSSKVSKPFWKMALQICKFCHKS